MPVYFKKSLESGGEIGIWQITEDSEYFERRMDLFPEEKKNLEELHPKKKKEWLAARFLLHLMSGTKIRSACIKDEFGKPYLKGSQLNISMSHSFDKAAVIVSPKSCGIDIQLKVPKIERIVYKFLSQEEFDQIGHEDRLEILHCYWGAKESIYKAYGKKSVDFKKHMFISPFVYQNDGFDFNGSLKKTDPERIFNLHASSYEDYILVYALEE